MTKICNECGIEKEINDFYHKLDKYTAKCRLCLQKIAKSPDAGEKRRAYQNKTYHDNIEMSRAACVKNRNRNIIQSLIIKIRNTTDREFNIVKSDLFLPDTCPILGIPIILSDKTRVYSPSIDRIDNNSGYLPDNVIIVANKSNRLKRDSTLEELWNVYNKYKNLQENKEEWFEV